MSSKLVGGGDCSAVDFSDGFSNLGFLFTGESKLKELVTERLESDPKKSRSVGIFLYGGDCREGLYAVVFCLSLEFRMVVFLGKICLSC